MIAKARVGTLEIAYERFGRAGDPPVLIAAVDRALEVLNWRPELDLTAMVRDAWTASWRA